MLFSLLRLTVRRIKFVLDVLSSFSVPSFHSLHEISTILRGTTTEIRLELLLQESSAVTQAEKERVLHSLLNTKHFAEAQLFAVLVDIKDDRITLKEVSTNV